MSELNVSEQIKYRLQSEWTDEDTARSLLQEMQQAGIDVSKLSIEERRVMAHYPEEGR